MFGKSHNAHLGIKIINKIKTIKSIKPALITGERRDHQDGHFESECQIRKFQILIQMSSLWNRPCRRNRSDCRSGSVFIGQFSPSLSLSLVG